MTLFTFFVRLYQVAAFIGAIVLMMFMFGMVPGYR